MAHVKGKDVYFGIENGPTSFLPLAASESCDLNITANTADAAAKDDPGEGMFDNPEFLNYSWSMSNTSFVVSIPALIEILSRVINDNAQFRVAYKIDKSKTGIFKIGNAIMTNLEIDATNGEYAKLSVSFDGNGELANASASDSFDETVTADKIRGKSLMVAYEVSQNTFATIACASSHKLTVTVSTEDVTDKDYNDKTVIKEVVGKSVKLTTSNLIDADKNNSNGIGIDTLFDTISTGKAVKMKFGYYSSAVGSSIHGAGRTHPEGWGNADATLLTGTFLCTSLSNNGTHKQNATFDAEFTSKGEVTVTAPAASALSEDE